MRSQTYPSCRSLSFQLVLLKPSENPINPRLKKKRVYFNLHFIAVVSQPCMLQRIYHSTALCILLWSVCRTGAIFGPFQGSRNEREASAERESCASRLTRATRSSRTSRSPAKRKNNACSEGYFWSAKIPWHSCHILVSRSEGLGRAKSNVTFVLFTIPGPVPCGQWYYGRVILVQWVSMGLWLQLTPRPARHFRRSHPTRRRPPAVNILAFLLLMVNFKWLTIFSIVVKHVLLV